MKNIAIIIGIDKYENNQDLLACKNDAEDMHKIISNSGKYDEEIYCSGKYSNNDIIKKIEKVKNKYENEDVGEIFFYFTGHGFSQSDELFYITSNTENDKINTTSLKNSEIDALIRKLNPNMYVKVIDACQSGISYIKDIGNENIQKIMQDSQASFNKCYFMFSSLKNQSSYIMPNNHNSYFTDAYIKSLIYFFKDENREKVKYSEIANYISDIFIKNDKQKPFFVTQTDLTDVFISNNVQLTQVLDEILNVEQKKVDKDLTVMNLDEIINKKILNCAKKEEAKLFSDKLNESIDLCSLNKYNLDKYYELNKYTNGEINNIPHKKYIANWILDNRKSLGLFAKAKLEDERKSKLYPIMNLSLSLSGEEKESRYEFEVTENAVCSNIKLEIKPKELGLEKYELIFVCIPSFSKIYIFKTFINDIPIAWNEYECDKVEEWTMDEFLIKNDLDKIDKYVEETFNTFVEYCKEKLNILLEGEN